VSPSWPRRLEIALSPSSAAWTCGGARGACAGAPAEAFAAALAAAPRARHVAVILCGALARYLVVPWPAEVEDESEGLALVAHHFRRVFGEQARDWVVRFDAEEGAARLACAAPRALLDALRTAAGVSGRRLESVQPFLAAFFNLWRRDFGRGAALYVTLEPGRWCAALVSGGEWRSLRSGRLDSDPAQALVELVAREAALAGEDALPARVYAPAFAQLDGRLKDLGAPLQLLRRKEEPLYAAPAH
jgi:hypothetical protein